MAKNNIFNLEELFARDFGASSRSVAMDNVAVTINRILADTSAQMSEMVSDFSEQSNGRERMWGAFLDGEAVEVFDDLAKAPTSTPVDGQLVQFPLRFFKKASGFTDMWLRRATPADMAKKVADITYAFNQRMIDEIKFSLFNKTTYSYKDWMTDNVTLSYCLPFINADSRPIPNAIGSGASFTASSHQHYVGTAGAALAAADITTLIANVQEHGLKGLELRINASNVSTLENLASTKFVALTHSILTNVVSGTVVTDNPAMDDPNNMLVGYWNGIPVRTKVYVPANYYMCIATGSQESPLVYRVSENYSGISPIGKYGDSVLSVEEFGWAYGFAAYNRAACAFLKGNAQTTYANPTLIR